MTRYRLLLTGGHSHVGDDEREIDEVMSALTRSDDDLPQGWVWIAGIRVKREHVIGVNYYVDGHAL